MTQLYGRPFVNYAPTLWTYRDLIDRLIDFSNAGTQAAQQRDYKVAIDEAYREVVYNKDWKYYLGTWTLYLPAPYSTGTITYTQSTRTLTLAGGTWPSWALYGHVKIGTAFYEVESVSSSTVLILAVNNNPGADVAALTTYTIYQSVFTLPSGFTRLMRPTSPTGSWASAYLPPDQWLRLEMRTASAGTPVAWTIMADPKNFGSFAIYVWPYPSAAQTYTFIYKRRPKDLVISGYDTADADYASSATLNASSGGTGFTSAGATFPTNMAGAMLRFGTAADRPDGLFGLKKYAEQCIISSYTSSSVGVLMNAPSYSYSAVKWNISDPIDMSPSMLEYLLATAKYRYSINRPSANRVLGPLKQAMDEAMIRAFENDSMVMGIQYEGAFWDIMHDHTYDSVP